MQAIASLGLRRRQRLRTLLVAVLAALPTLAGAQISPNTGNSPIRDNAFPLMSLSRFADAARLERWAIEAPPTRARPTF